MTTDHSRQIRKLKLRFLEDSEARKKKAKNHPEDNLILFPQKKKFKRGDVSKQLKPFHAAIPNEIAVPSPFGVYSRKEKLDNLKTPIVLEYGKYEIMITGQKLNVKDSEVFIALTQLAVERDNLRFVSDVNELCRKLGTPYSKTSKKSIKESLWRLVGARVETISKEKNQWILHHMIEWAVGQDEKIIITLDKFFDRLFGRELMTSLDTRFRLSLRGDITKQLYVFYQRQVSARKKQPYYKHKIGIEKLCDLIGLDRDYKRPMFLKRQQIKDALKELKTQKYLRSYSLKNDLIRVVIVNAKKCELPKLPESKKPKLVTENKPDEPISRGKALLKYVEAETGIKITGDRARAERKALRIQAIGQALRLNYSRPGYTLFDEFADWLKEQKEIWLSAINWGTLDPEKEVFSRRFMKDMQYEMPSEEEINRHFERLTESEIQQAARLKEEHEEKAKAKAEAEAKAEADRKYEEDIKWVGERMTKIFRDKKTITDSLFHKLPPMIVKLEEKHGKDWKTVFERYLQAVEKEHQKGLSLNLDVFEFRRHYTYSVLMRDKEIWSKYCAKMEGII